LDSTPSRPWDCSKSAGSVDTLAESSEIDRCGLEPTTSCRVCRLRWVVERKTLKRLVLREECYSGKSNWQSDCKQPILIEETGTVKPVKQRGTSKPGTQTRVSLTQVRTGTRTLQLLSGTARSLRGSRVEENVPQRTLRPSV